ncbi:hypothetical protein LTR85_007877 [Meristemomyces frigidus]|nr:hypothetical protein LTR85_007877 [Meristemomyces frigidus]
MATRAAEVFAIPELLESILLQLPAKDLLFAQSICASFRNAIANSIKIQRTLYPKPSPANPEDASAAPRLNPLIRHLLEAAMTGIKLCEPGCAGRFIPDCSDASEAYHIHVNTLDCDRPEQLWQELRPGSWQEMMIASPPCPVFRVDNCRSMGPCHYKEFGVARIGELVATFRKEAEEDAARRAEIVGVEDGEEV